jgi:alpha-N-arabinofuranosidase
VTKPGSAGAGVANDGYWGIPVQPKTTYRASFFAKATGFSGSVTLSLESADGHTVYASRKVKGIGAEWRQLEATLTTGDLVATDKARYVLRLDQPGTVWFGFVSLFPPTWNNRTNGFRKDLMQLLVDTKPKFLRFPGGNYLEGNKIAERFEWKKTIGPIARRPGHQSPWGYRSTDGMGLLEFLQWCEDMGAEPVLAVYAGYSLEGERVKAGPDLEPYVQDALEEIEYVTGGANTRWGAQRVKDGHPAPFALHYVEIGNEDGFDKENTYDGRFTQFFDAIKDRYPALKCIATITPNDKKEKQVHSRAPQVFDEHYYDPVDGFLAKGRSHYDNYDRKGPEIFVGEWAAYETAFPPWNEKSKQEAPTPNLRAAIGDAAFMTNMERNSDVVVMHCYAPLFVNVNPGGRQWRPDMIGYDALRSYGSPSYYAFRLFSTHVGDEILKVTPAAENSLFASVTRASATGEIYLKLVNARPEPATVAIELPGVTHLGAEATAWVLAAPSDAATNSMTSPTAVVPQRQTVTGVHSGFTYSVPANGIVVLVLQSKK